MARSYKRDKNGRFASGGGSGSSGKASALRQRAQSATPADRQARRVAGAKRRENAALDKAWGARPHGKFSQETMHHNNTRIERRQAIEKGQSTSYYRKLSRKKK